MGLVPKKHSQKMHMAELVVGAIIATLPALTSEMTVSHAAMIMMGFTVVRAYLVSIKQS